jgi:ribonucleotide monophosphatase NagD (HAD superfamily)
MFSAVAAVERLREAGLGPRFVTNKTTHSRERTLHTLERLGSRSSRASSWPRPRWPSATAANAGTAASPSS